MKKFSKILGIGLTIAVLASMLVATAPASAGNQVFSKDSRLVDVVGKIAAGTDVVDIAVAADGATAYAALSNSTVWKTADGGNTWAKLTAYTGGAVSSIAVAPDQANYVAVASGTTLYISLTAGATFGTVAPTTGFGTINDVAIGPTVGTGRSLAVADATNGFWVYGPIPNNVFGDYAWNAVSTGNVTGTALAAKFSPSFATGDYTVAAVTANATGAFFNVYNTYFGKWNADYALYGAPNLGVPLAATAATKADIALPAAFYGFDSARVAYVALDTGSLFRVKATSSTNLFGTTSTAVYSVDYSNSADKLVAGAVGSATAYTLASPATATAAPTASSTLKGPGGTGNVVARFFGTKVGVGTTGNESAFALSATGSTFNDVAFVDTDPAVKDLAVGAAKTFLVTYNAGTMTTSLWRKTTNWERVYRVTGANWIVRNSLDNFDVVFLAQTGTNDIRYSNDAGETTWQIRVGPAQLIDLAVQTPSIMYALSAVDGMVKATDSGIIWTKQIVAIGTGSSMRLLSENNLLISGSSGVAYTTDGGTTWSAVLALTGACSAVADKLTSGGVIYAIAGTAVKKYTIGTSTAFADTVATTAYAVDSIARLGTLTYVMTENGAAYTMYRAPVTNTTWSALTATTMALFNLQAAGGKLWALSSDNGIYVFTEVLAAAGPNPLLPVDKFLDQINIETGKADAIVFQWDPVPNSTAITGLTYNLNIYLDAACTQRVYEVFTTNALNVLGPTGGYDFQANTLYFWKVRVSGPVDSPWSAVRGIKIDMLSPIKITSPLSGASDVPVLPTLVWTAVRDATQYQLSVATDKDFQNVLFSKNATTPLYAFEEGDKLEYNTVYYWRVKASNPDVAETAYVFGIFTTEQKPTTPAPPITITQPAPTTITVSVPPQQEVIPAYLLWIIIGIGAILVIALIVLIVRTRRVS